MSSALLENPLREGVGEGAGLHNPLVTWQGGWAQGLSGFGDPQGWGGGLALRSGDGRIIGFGGTLRK